VQRTSNAQLEADVERRTMTLYDDVSTSIERVSALYKEISEQNLNPDTVLYFVNSPFIIRTTSPLTVPAMAQYLLLALFSALILVPLAFLGLDGVLRWTDAARSRPASRSH
jgi:hypothetical protein